MIRRESAGLPAGHEKSAKILRQFRRECPPAGDFLLVGFRYWPGTSGLACRNKRRSCAAAVSRQSLLQPGCRHGYGVGAIRGLSILAKKMADASASAIFLRSYMLTREVPACSAQSSGDPFAAGCMLACALPWKEAGGGPNPFRKVSCISISRAFL